MEHSAAHLDERFRVANPVEVLAYLREATRSRILCAVRACGHSESFLSRLFALQPDAQALVFDMPRAPVILRALTPGALATVELTLHHVRIHFDAPVRRVAPYEGEESLFVAIPESIVRLQRRENYRITVPTRRNLHLTLDAAYPDLSDLRLVDLSCGGASIVLSGSLEDYPTGRVFEHARLSLDADTEFVCDVRVRHASAMRLSGSVGDLRVGVQFIRTPPGFEPAVARTVNEIARELGHLKSR